MTSFKDILYCLIMLKNDNTKSCIFSDVRIIHIHRLQLCVSYKWYDVMRNTLVLITSGVMLPHYEQVASTSYVHIRHLTLYARHEAGPQITFQTFLNKIIK